MKKATSVLKYLAMLGVAVFLLTYALKGYPLESLLHDMGAVDYRWILLSIALAMTSHWLRAYRWNILLRPLGYQNLNSFRTLLCVMSGYLANLAVPRMGEVTKCGALRKTDEVPMTTSLGSVVTERFIDLICLLISLTLTFLVERNRLKDFSENFIREKMSGLAPLLPYLYWIAAIGFVVALGGLFFFWKNKKKLRKYPLFGKAEHIVRQVVDGLLSFRKMKNVPGFLISTTLIWVLYFLMTYVVFFAIPETSSLSWGAGLAAFAFGGIAMTAPVSGGIGTYHLIVSAILMLYGVNHQSALLYATVMHAAQTVMTIFFGGIGLFGSIFISKRKKHEQDKHTVENT
ncbi:dolichol-P-glucose synthetase [Fulvitalea axinellae]|uniref:Dolichol-P-glucose synthetase n=1 Tax=Fulvitalea axinellae TaxID=1182444 RepID=A0AAU9CIK2_9BACT|nr:dolichol-P-glucose synthetase [Fulvitalea axinellae]